MNSKGGHCGSLSRSVSWSVKSRATRHASSQVQQQVEKGRCIPIRKMSVRLTFPSASGDSPDGSRFRAWQLLPGMVGRGCRLCIDVMRREGLHRGIAGRARNPHAGSVGSPSQPREREPLPRSALAGLAADSGVRVEARRASEARSPREHRRWLPRDRPPRFTKRGPQPAVHSGPSAVAHPPSRPADRHPARPSSCSPYTPRP